MKALLYKMEKSPMQSGLAKVEIWILKPIAETKIHSKFKPMNWHSSSSTKDQLTMKFNSREQALSYCKHNEISYTEVPFHEKSIKKKSYTETITQ